MKVYCIPAVEPGCVSNPSELTVFQGLLTVYKSSQLLRESV